MIKYVECHPELTFVFKPHPGLEKHIINCQARENFFMTPEGYKRYLDKWNSLKNGVVVTDGDYISLFKNSSCLITDSGSFIVEYLPSGNPCLYLFNGEQTSKSLNEFALDIVDSYYKCFCWEEIEEYLSILFVKMEDPLSDQRKEKMSKYMHNVGNASKAIVDNLMTFLDNN